MATPGIPHIDDILAEQIEFLMAEHGDDAQHGYCEECGRYQAVKALLLARFR